MRLPIIPLVFPDDASEKEKLKNGQLHILIVDDEPNNIDLLEAVFRKRARFGNKGLEISKAYDGDEAISKAKNLLPDLILLDVRIPGRDGYEVCKTLKADKDTRLIPIIMVSGLDSLSDRVKGLEAGADDFLVKPFIPAELIARAKTAIKVKRYTDHLEHAELVITSLVKAGEVRDPYTQGHSEKVAMLAIKMGVYYGLEEDSIYMLQQGSVLHDLGKLAIPEEVLFKPGRLNEIEWSVMKTHPLVGEQICSTLKTLTPLLQVIRCHHEKWDGSGYPDGLSGSAIPFTSQIIGIADAYDALTSDRPYRSALSDQETFSILQEETHQGKWNPELLPLLQDALASQD